ncbi:GCAT [Cordylochernes scorpioides]|uniref:GCAT n=1 Tax=Cordylochernes scorpioides TaxID=51811 RepID=A0ABY6LXR2_9ARAC|nr:GCAT [Cordylochernes scorpioides]
MKLSQANHFKYPLELLAPETASQELLPRTVPSYRYAVLISAASCQIPNEASPKHGPLTYALGLKTRSKAKDDNQDPPDNQEEEASSWNPITGKTKALLQLDKALQHAQESLFNSADLKGIERDKGDNHPICPVMLGDAKLATIFADKMLEQGIYVIGFSYPVVPKGKARIRVQISAAHSTEEILTIIEAFENVGKELKII